MKIITITITLIIVLTTSLVMINMLAGPKYNISDYKPTDFAWSITQTELKINDTTTITLEVDTKKDALDNFVCSWQPKGYEDPSSQYFKEILNDSRLEGGFVSEEISHEQKFIFEAEDYQTINNKPTFYEIRCFSTALPSESITVAEKKYTLLIS